MSDGLFRRWRPESKRAKGGGDSPSHEANGTEGDDEGAKAPGLRGFGANTPLETSFGVMPAQYIRRGDPLRIGQDAFLSVARVHTYVLEPDVLRRHPQALPVALDVKSAYADLSRESVVVAPDQPVVLRDPMTPSGGRIVPASRMGRVLRSAEALEQTLTYFRFEFERPVRIFGGGFWFVP